MEWKYIITLSIMWFIIGVVCALLLITGCSKELSLVSPYDVPVMRDMQEVVEYMNGSDFGDCVEAAETAFIACKSIGYDAIMVSLRGNKWHRVCIAWDEPGKWHLFSNSRHGLIQAGDWREATLAFFEADYKKIVIVAEHDQGSIY